MSANDLAFELVSVIIRLACADGDNKVDLEACAGVSKQWRAASYPLLFHKLRVADEPSLERLESLLNREPDIGPCVRKLLVTQTSTPRSINSPLTSIPATLSPYNWIADIHRTLPEKLTALETIELVDLGPPGSPYSTDFFERSSRFETVSTLNVQSCRMNLSLIYMFIASLPRLHNLGLYSFEPALPLETENIPSRPYTLAWKSVVVDCGDILEGMDAILKSMEVFSDKIPPSLSLGVRRMDTRIVAEFLVKNGSSLEELTLSAQTHSGEMFLEVRSISEITRGPNEISLHSCSKLRSLTICDRSWFPFFFTPLQYHLEGIASPHISEVILEFSNYKYLCNIMQVPAIQSLFDTGSLKDMKKLKLVYHGSAPLDTVVEQFSDCSSAMHARLEIVAAPPRPEPSRRAGSDSPELIAV